MKTIGQILLGLALAGWLGAQTQPPPGEIGPREKHIFQAKYADVRDLANVLGIFGYRVDSNVDLRVLTVSAPHDVVTAMEDVLQRLDVPAAAPKDIELVIDLVVASQQAQGPGGVPAEIQPVANELKSVLSFKSFRMLDTILLRTQPGKRATAEGVIGVGPDRTQYEFAVGPANVTEDPKGHFIRLSNLALKLHLSGGVASVNTDITVREGQKVVVGKSNMGGSDQALILVVAAKVTE